MKPFRFSLEPLHSLRKHKEDAARERYAKTVRACEEAAARVQAASIELTACWKSLCEKLAGGVTGDDLLRVRAWCNVLELRVKDRANALEQARLAVDAVWIIRSTSGSFPARAPWHTRCSAGRVDEKGRENAKICRVDPAKVAG
jgi:hypothetical protein